MNICMCKLKIEKYSKQDKESHLQFTSCQTFTLHIIANERRKRKWKRPVEKWRRIAIVVSAEKIYHSLATPGGTYFSF